MQTNGYNSINDQQPQYARLSPFIRFVLFVVFSLCVVTLAISVIVLKEVRSNGNDSANNNDAMNALQAMLMRMEMRDVHKFAVPLLVPREYQEQRGTCWDFTTVEFLEHQYRLQGIQQGFLRPNQYVKFSKQAYGSMMIDLCKNNDICKLPGDSIAFNSTEGGEVPLLFYFAPQLSNSVLPEMVCPYTPFDGQDQSCPGMDAALKNNPLKFTMNESAYTTLYDIESIKHALFTRKRLLAWSSSMFTTNYYFPCVGSQASDPQCGGGNTSKCTLCPSNQNFATACCVKFSQPMYNIDGEFYYHNGMELEGGHAMALVGYNDMYETRDGFTGGFILRNTWHDVGRRGSHSLRYFMKEISDMDERAICPNSMNPRNWYACVNHTDCISKAALDVATLAYQPLGLKCVNSSECDNSTTTTYFLQSLIMMDNGLAQGCFFVDKNGADGGSFCLSPRVLELIPSAIQPIQTWNNTDDECGYYFFPYEVLLKSVAQFGGFFVNDFPVVWDPQSYPTDANIQQYTNLNYTLVKLSVQQQMFKNFSGPYPNFPPPLPPVSA